MQMKEGLCVQCKWRSLHKSQTFSWTKGSASLWSGRNGYEVIKSSPLPLPKPPKKIQSRAVCFPSRGTFWSMSFSMATGSCGCFVVSSQHHRVFRAASASRRDIWHLAGCLTSFAQGIWDARERSNSCRTGSKEAEWKTPKWDLELRPPAPT